MRQKKIKEVNVVRLDKFLKVSRIIKRRTVAKEVADKGRIQINGVLAKSSSTVKIGDLVKIQFGNRILEVEVLQLNDSTKKEDATKMYEIKSETRVSEE
ncbi:RNA-binding S4 domain-containing protein [Enterococcus faecalis]